MKKIAILASMFAVVALSSCGGGENKEGENTDSTTTETAPAPEETPAPEVVDSAATTDTTAHAE